MSAWPPPTASPANPHLHPGPPPPAAPTKPSAPPERSLCGDGACPVPVFGAPKFCHPEGRRPEGSCVHPSSALRDRRRRFDSREVFHRKQLPIAFRDPDSNHIHIRVQQVLPMLRRLRPLIADVSGIGALRHILR